MKIVQNEKINKSNLDISGEFINLSGERYYVIHNFNEMEPFFMSIVSDSDHWLFISSTGGLTAGRVSSQRALFPYIPVDRVHESYHHTGSKTLIRVKKAHENEILWEPFLFDCNTPFDIEYNLYKNTLGNKICFEEINNDLNLTFRYTYKSSHKYGFVRSCELEYSGEKPINIELLDGLQNILPAGIESELQNSASNLIDAYKWNELDEKSGLAIYSLYSGLTDRPQPYEVLHANTVFCLGLKESQILLSSKQLKSFRRALPVHQESVVRGRRGAFFVNSHLTLHANEVKRWEMVAGLNQTQAQVVSLRDSLINDSQSLSKKIAASVQKGTDKLYFLMSSVDAFEVTEQENATVHHYANVLFNSMRGGIFVNQYQIQTEDFVRSIAHFNHALYKQYKTFFDTLPHDISFKLLMEMVTKQNDSQLHRLSLEYLPITFGRRHGDPSRPWNRFAIYLNDKDGNPLLNYEGNWRDIFQNWEALTFSYPEFTESIIAKFVNASTIDGYNPYRIEKKGIDWEVEDSDDPWSFIGYWGDHQIIYLLKLLEQSKLFNPQKLQSLLDKTIFSYANVPYRIKSIDSIFQDPKDTIIYDFDLADRIEKRTVEMGADGKLVLDHDGNVYLVNLLEKLLVPLLSKLSNFVLDGGIWMNTQRPEWNDANNALVGQGLSMVTIYYLRRYIVFLQELIQDKKKALSLSVELKYWLIDTGELIKNSCNTLNGSGIHNKDRFELLRALGQAATTYREAVYQQEGFSGVEQVEISAVKALLNNALIVIEHTISNGRRSDNLYHAYNLLSFDRHEINVKHLYPMLEGQVAALSSGSLSTTQVINTLEALFKSSLLRQDLQTFLLYPDRKGVKFLEKNRISDSDINTIPILRQMLSQGDEQIVLQDSSGQIRFHPSLINKEALDERINMLLATYNDSLQTARRDIQLLFEKVYNHQEFTGRSGGMFGFEGLGCTYWHMVSKLLLAVQECFFVSLKKDHDKSASDSLREYYYRVREGLGFNKSPLVYGAFPTDPYSHTPSKSGAKQPGMTGSVKEEILTRFGELGIRIENARVMFLPKLLQKKEFLLEPNTFEYYDVFANKREINLSTGMLAFTWCQLPIIYQLDEMQKESIIIHWKDKNQQQIDGNQLPAEISKEIFGRSGRIEKLIFILSEKFLI